MELITTKRLKLTPDEYKMVKDTAQLLSKIRNELKGDILPLIDGEETTTWDLDDILTVLHGLADSSISTL